MSQSAANEEARWRADLDRSDSYSASDGTAVTIAFEAFHGELFAFLRRSTRDDDAAEDLLHDAFERLAAEICAGRPPQNTRAWLYRVASNLAVSRARRRSTASMWLAQNGHMVSEASESTESAVLRREGRTELHGVIDGLPSDARTALLLSSDGFSGDEIAAAIGRTNGATRALLTRTRIALRIALQQRAESA